MFLVGTEEGKIYKVRQRGRCASSLWGGLDLSTLQACCSEQTLF